MTRVSVLQDRFGAVLVLLVFLSLRVFIPGNLGVRAEDPTTEEEVLPTTAANDKKALLDIKSWLKRKNPDWTKQRLMTWNGSQNSDPCRDRWAYIACRCQDLPLHIYPEYEEDCDDYRPRGNWSRVISVGLIGGSLPDEKFIGRLPPALGNLKRLRLALFRDNAFTGSIPKSYGNLSSLRRLELSGNALSGKIPNFLATNLTRLKNVELANNQFKGRLPAIGCRTPEKDKHKFRLVVKDNEGLCGRVPRCVRKLIDDMSGTYLYRQSEPNNSMEGDCDTTKPVCKATGGCRIDLPRHWTDPATVHFSFTPFIDRESKILSYQVFIKPNRTVVSTATEETGQPSESEEEQPDVVIPVSSQDFEDAIKPFWNKYFAKETMVNLSIATETLPLSLVNGESYNVEVVATNWAGPPLEERIFNGTVQFDYTKPVFQEIYNQLFGRNSQPDQEKEGAFGASWTDPFIDEESNITRVYLSICEAHKADVDDCSLYNKTLKKNATKFRVRDRYQFEAGKQYFYRVVATNGAGLDRVSDSIPFRIKPPEPVLADTARNNTDGGNPSIVSSDQRTWIAALIAATMILLVGIVAALLMYRSCASSKSLSKSLDPDNYLKEFLMQLVAPNRDETRTPSPPLPDQSELAFVITGDPIPAPAPAPVIDSPYLTLLDLEGSAAQSNVNEEASKQLNYIHDMLIRTTYEEFRGYEINTEGDAFQLAFGTVASAILFCVNVQLKFLDFKWSTEILSLPSCHPRKDGAGRSYTFRGPRVRMGIHWAKKELISVRVHQYTRHHVFEGPAFNVAQEISTIANGGQILMSHDAWANFENEFPKAGFPTIEVLGLYKLSTWPEYMAIYNVSQRVGQKLIRSFPYLKEIQSEPSAAGVCIIPPPVPDSEGMLTFAAVQIENQPDDRSASLLAVHMTFELTLQYAQYFVGHCYDSSEEEGRVMIAFQSVLNAVRFSLALQMALVLNHWPVEVLSLYPPTIQGRNQIPLFHGPRVAIVVHSTNSFGVGILQETQLQSSRTSIFAGNGVAVVKHLASIAHGGQNILTSRTWRRVNGLLPPRVQTLSLGNHILGGTHDHARLLFEVLPDELKDRCFPTIRSKERVEDGYREAPTIDTPMSIVFVRAQKPQIVRTFEEESLGEATKSSETRDTIAAFHASLQTFSAIVRRRLSRHQGYECKEPEKGKFTLAFAHLENAIRWACHLQSELIRIDWPETLLSLEECKKEVRNGQVIHRGLKVKIGIAHGMVCDRHPINTGRADYFGQIPNLAARVTQLAKPGQVLIHTTERYLKSTSAYKAITSEVGFMPYSPPLDEKEDGVNEVVVEITRLGCFFLRGFDELKLIFQAQSSSLSCVNRFGTIDAETLYKNRTQRTKLWIPFRRSPLRNMPETTSFYSHSTIPPWNYSLSHSPPDSLRTGSPSMIGRWVTPSASSSLNGRPLNGRLPSIQMSQHEDDVEMPPGDGFASELDTLPSIAPLSPFADYEKPTAFKEGPSTTSTSSHEQRQSSSTTNQNLSGWQDFASNRDRAVSSTEDFLASVGTSISGQKKFPPPVNRRSSEEETTPTEYGQQVASLYSTVQNIPLYPPLLSHSSGFESVEAAERNAQEFSFHSQKPDSSSQVGNKV